MPTSREAADIYAKLKALSARLDALESQPKKAPAPKKAAASKK